MKIILQARTRTGHKLHATIAPDYPVARCGHRISTVIQEEFDPDDDHSCRHCADSVKEWRWFERHGGK